MPFRSHLKEEAHKRHEEEKNYMATLQAVGVSVSHYTGYSVSDDNCIPDEQIDTADTNCIPDEQIDTADTPIPLLQDTSDATPDEGELLFLYDCETTRGSSHNDHIMELASMVIVSDDVNISKPHFTSLCNTSRHIVQKGLYVCMYVSNTNNLVISTVSEKCGITSCMLYNQPSFNNVFQQFIKWIEHCVLEVQQQKEVSCHPGILISLLSLLCDVLFSISSTQWICL